LLDAAWGMWWGCRERTHHWKQRRWRAGAAENARVIGRGTGDMLALRRACTSLGVMREMYYGQKKTRMSPATGRDVVEMQGTRVSLDAVQGGR
jgi:hypothetical protein